MSVPRSMKAAVLTELRKPLVVAEIGLPRKLDVGQVLVKIRYSGICGSQLGEIDGAKGADKYLPHLLGHEGSGQVVMTGAGVRSVLPGDNVVLHWRKGKGIESQVPTYTIDGGKVNAGWITTFNEWGIISENRLTVIPKDIDLQIAALFGCAVTTGFGVIVNNVRVRIGESLVIFGAGGVGLNIVQAARLAGAHPIIAVDLYDNRLDLARRMGATHVINSQTLDAEKEILGALSGRPLDCFIDNTGNPASIQLGYRITGPKGRVGLVGVPRKGDDITIYSLPLHFGKILTGSHGGEAMPTEDIPRYISLLLAGRLSLSELITNVYQLSDINLAIDDMRNGRTAGRTLVDLGE